MMLFFRPLLKLGFICLLTASAHAEENTRSRVLMGTLLTITAETQSQKPLTEAFNAVAGIESWMSTYRDGSELSRLNASAGSGPVKVSNPLWSVLVEARRVWRLSKGAFDPAYASPGGFRRIEFNPRDRSVSLPKGVRLDLGGIGKGWALDRAAQVLRAHGVASARLDFGGQILVFSPSPRRNVRLVEIADPVCRRTPVSTGRSISCPSPARFHLGEGSVATSAANERPGHLIDPKTGAAAAGTGRSVSIAAPTAAAADAWSTAVFIGGPGILPPSDPICALSIARDAIVQYGNCETYRIDNTRRKS